MTDEIDRLIGADRNDEAQLGGLEDKVWTRVSDRLNENRTGQIRLAVVALSLVVGVANGGLMLLAPRPVPSEMQVFTVSAGLLPLAGLGVPG
jgi:hypothetical protein